MNRAARALQIPVGGALAERMALFLLFLLGTVLGAYVEIPLPFTPVPVTLQTLFVLLCAAWIGAGWGAAVQALYLSSGALGAGVFAGAASGFVQLAGPTAGYLWAFLPAAVLVGSLWKAAASRGILGKALLFAAADFLILACGTLWLAAFLHVGAVPALVMGLVPFLPGEAAKIALAVAFSPRNR
jgi:biotin transport system substrate-specific component